MRTNGELTDYLASSGVLKSEKVLNAFRAIDRADFVCAKDASEAYDDYPLPIGYGATISQPTTVAFMLELLQADAGDKILDVGSGSAWTTALLAHIAGSTGYVFGVEIVPELLVFGQNNLKKYTNLRAEIRQAEQTVGLAHEAPFDKILVSAAANTLPEELIEQLKPGGKMIIPIQSSIWEITKSDNGAIATQEHYGFSFVPLK